MEYSFFGLQIAVQAPFDSHLRGELGRLVNRPGERETFASKRSFWTRVSELMRRSEREYVLGHWDLIRGEDGLAEFKSWTSEIEGAVAVVDPPNPAAINTHHARLEIRHILFTSVFLVERHSNSDTTLGERCDIAESEYFTRATFVHLLGTLPRLNFASVASDAIYVVPGTRAAGLSTQELQSEGYEYLRPLS